MQILCDSPSIQKALAAQAELSRLIQGHIERLSEVEGYDLSQLVRFIIMAKQKDTHFVLADLAFRATLHSLPAPIGPGKDRRHDTASLHPRQP